MREYKSHSKINRNHAVGYMCPYCNSRNSSAVTFENEVVEHNKTYYVAWCRCYEPACAKAFQIFHCDNIEVYTYPPARFGFNFDSIPEDIVSAINEALQAHQHELFRCAAIMLRRSVELIVEHLGGKGANLRNRISSLLEGKLDSGFVAALNDLRLLGNDAAHLKLKSFDGVSKNEVDKAIAVIAEIVRVLFQQKEILERLAKCKTDEPGGATES